MSPSDAPVILAFDTSAAHCAAALLSGDLVLAQRTEAMDRGQAERLLPMLTELLAEAGVAFTDLDAIAVCTGPGNFTGIRIGVATARGLALGLGAPAIGVSRLEALAHDTPGTTLVGIDAHRGGIYVQTFRDGAALDAPRLIDADTGASLDPDLTRLGAVAFGAPPGSSDRADPASLGRIARGRLGSPQPRPAPLYLRPADAARSPDLVPRLLDDA